MTACIVTGLVTGLGKQLTGAILAFGSYWCIGLPLAAVLAFSLGWGTLGLWLALAAATLLQCGAMSVVALRLNWKQEAERAMANVDRDRAALASQPGTPSSSMTASLLRTAEEAALHVDSQLSSHTHL